MAKSGALRGPGRAGKGRTAPIPDRYDLSDDEPEVVHSYSWKTRTHGRRIDTVARRQSPGPPGRNRSFPGCTPRRIPRAEIERYEGRIEYWDSIREIAWVAEPTSPYHEQPVETLSALVDRISAVRGSPVKCYGSMDLWLRDEGGKPRRILQADQSVYLHPTRAVLPGLSAMVLGEHDFPDVVLEVDRSTDVRRGKLGLYEEWGFPEVWVEVPDTRAPSRPRGRLPGLTIHLMSDDGTYRVSPESRCLSRLEGGADPRRAERDDRVRADPCAILERIGLALGAREGTGPDDDPLASFAAEPGLRAGAAYRRGPTWSAGFCSRGASRSRTTSPPACPPSPNRRTTPSSTPPSPARARATSGPVSARTAPDPLRPTGLQRARPGSCEQGDAIGAGTARAPWRPRLTRRPELGARGSRAKVCVWGSAWTEL